MNPTKKVPQETIRKAEQKLALYTALSVIHWPPYRASWVPEAYLTQIDNLLEVLNHKDLNEEENANAKALLMEYHTQYHALKENQSKWQ